jgi:hypothetical protein
LADLRHQAAKLGKAQRPVHDERIDDRGLTAPRGRDRRHSLI